VVGGESAGAPVAGAGDTRERIIDGALRAVARHGLAKLAVADIGESAGVSRGTVYRYFPTRQELLSAVAAEEARRFYRRVLEVLENAPAGEERIRLMLEHATRHVVEHQALQRLLETEPAFVLESLREQFGAIRETMGRLLEPFMEETAPVRVGVVSAGQLVDWTVRMMITAFLFPARSREEMADGLMAMFKMLSVEPDARTGKDGSGGPRTKERRR